MIYKVLVILQNFMAGWKTVTKPDEFDFFVDVKNTKVNKSTCIWKKKALDTFL